METKKELTKDLLVELLLAKNGDCDIMEKVAVRAANSVYDADKLGLTFEDFPKDYLLDYYICRKFYDQLFSRFEAGKDEIHEQRLLTFFTKAAGDEITNSYLAKIIAQILLLVSEQARPNWFNLVKKIKDENTLLDLVEESPEIWDIIIGNISDKSYAELLDSYDDFINEVVTNQADKIIEYLQTYSQKKLNYAPDLKGFVIKHLLGNVEPEKAEKLLCFLYMIDIERSKKVTKLFNVKDETKKAVDLLCSDQAKKLSDQAMLEIISMLINAPFEYCGVIKLVDILERIKDPKQIEKVFSCLEALVSRYGHGNICSVLIIVNRCFLEKAKNPQELIKYVDFIGQATFTKEVTSNCALRLYFILLEWIQNSKYPEISSKVSDILKNIFFDETTKRVALDFVLKFVLAHEEYKNWLSAALDQAVKDGSLEAESVIRTKKGLQAVKEKSLKIPSIVRYLEDQEKKAQEKRDLLALLD